MADIPSCPRGREEEYLSDIAGLTDNAPNTPWSRKEAYLAAIDGKMDNIEEQIAALSADISFKGSVPTADDLPETAAVGDAYITEDTGIIYVYVGESGTEPWVALGGSGDSGIRVLTTADYDYHRTGNTDDGVALWRLPDGIYKTTAGIGTYVQASSSAYTEPLDRIYYVAHGSNRITIFYREYNDSGSLRILTLSTSGTVQRPGNTRVSEDGILLGSMVTDSIPSADTSTSRMSPLSANQGRILNAKIEAMALTNSEFNTLWENA